MFVGGTHRQCVRFLKILVFELVDTVDVSLYRSRHDVGVRTEAVVDVSIILHLHVHLAHIVAALADSLDGELLQHHLAVDDFLQ